jgi:antirestriction protein ArdC
MSYTNTVIKDVQDTILKHMDKYGTDWDKPWRELMSRSFPYNYSTKKNYTGFNIFWLSLASYKKGFNHNIWATYKQWATLGGTVKKGQKSTRVFYWELKSYEDKENVDANGKPEIQSRWFLKIWNVFNIDQVDGIELPKPKTINKVASIAKAEQFIKNTKAEIKIGGDRACYSPVLDYISMPTQEQFKATKTSSATENWYSTVLHELVHWTGHESRCKRNFKNSYFSQEYAMEELVAETGSAILTVMLGITKTPRPDHSQYLNSWKNMIRKKPKAIFTAFSKSTQAIEFLNSLQPKEKKKVA